MKLTLKKFECWSVARFRRLRAGLRVHSIFVITSAALLIPGEAGAISGKKSSVCGSWNNYCEGPSPTPRVQPRPEDLQAARQKRDASQLNESANDAVRAGNNHRAAELYREALRFSPDDPVIRANLLETEGIIAWEVENYELALRNIKHAHALRPLKHRADYISSLSQLIADRVRAERERAAEAERKALEYAAEGAKRQAQELRESMRAPVETQSAHEKRFPPPPPPVLPKNRALIGGMTWEYGTYAMNVPTGLSGEKARRARLESERQFKGRLKLAGIREDKDFELKEYNFILGVARSSKVWGDLGRVLLDDLKRGRATPSMQREYDLLRGRTFDALDCHSNGAMICLAALSNNHITLTEPRIVRLFGPQITHGALVEWQGLATTHKLDLRIYFNDGDAVPRISYLAQYLMSKYAGSPELTETVKDTIPVAEAVAREILLGDGLKIKIERDVPSAKVQSFTCGYVRDILFWNNCHKLSVYQNFLR